MTRKTDLRSEGRGKTSQRRREGPPGDYLAGLALFCFGFFGVFAFLSISLLDGSAGLLPGRRCYASAGMISRPIRSSCSRSSPFIR
jgi:hypothetical protein